MSDNIQIYYSSRMHDVTPETAETKIKKVSRRDAMYRQMKVRVRIGQTKSVVLLFSFVWQ